MSMRRRDLERKRQHSPRLQRIDQRIYMPPRRGVSRVQPALVVRTRALDALLKIRWNRLSLRFQPLQLRTVNRLHRRIALHHADARTRPAKSKVRVEALSRHG